MTTEHDDNPRRKFLAYFASAGLSGTLFPGVLWAQVEGTRPSKITKEMLRDAEKVAGLEFSETEREAMVQGLNDNLDRYGEARRISLTITDAPAQQFNPVLPGMTFEKSVKPFRLGRQPRLSLPANSDELAFWPVTHLAQLIRARKISSVELTQLFLARLKKYDAQLSSVITLTEELALKQASRADSELAAGRYRGTLHGIPWGAKDLLAARGYPTTWGAEPFRQQVFDFDATVVERLEKAGAVLVAKLATGELASGDIWFGGQVKTPWNLKEGTRGSSAGPGAATAAGMVAFSIGTETRGSITYPSGRCGLTGLRPTFGRVSRYGVMPLAFSLDKVGPMCHTAEDCAVVFDAIRGSDGKDRSLIDMPFNWEPDIAVRSLRIGYIKSALEQEHETPEGKANDEATLEILRSMGAKLIPVEYPDGPDPVRVQPVIQDTEAAAVFDEIVRNGRIDLLARKTAWPVRLRQARLVPGVEYVQAERARTKIMEGMAKMMADLDACLAPAGGPGTPPEGPIAKNVPIVNLTGYPGVILPNGFSANGIPTSITLIGKLFGEARILALAKQYQDRTDFHRKRPPLD